MRRSAPEINRGARERTLISSPELNPVSIRTLGEVGGGRTCRKRPVSGRKLLQTQVNVRLRTDFAT